MHGADGGSIGIGALIAHDTDAHHRQQNSKTLPDGVVEARGLDLSDDDIVGFLKQRDALGSYFAENADGQSRTGEWLAAEDVFRHLEIAADAADFVLEEIAQWFNEPELHELGQTAHVVMTFDGLAWAFDRRRLDDVGIERALYEPVQFAVGTVGFAGDAAGFVFKDGDELGADALAFRLRIGNSG